MEWADGLLSKMLEWTGLGSTVHDWGLPKNGPFWAKNGKAMASLSTFQSEPNRTKMANLSVFEHLGPYTSTFRAVVFTVHPHVIIYSHWPNEFFAPNGQSRVWRRCLRAKNKFLFEMVQKVPDGPKTFGKRVSNGQKHLGWPFWYLLDHFGTLTSLPCLAIFGPKWTFFGPSPVMNGGPQIEKRFITKSPMCGLLVELQNTMFGK